MSKKINSKHQFEETSDSSTELDIFKDDLVAIASHELRAPMTVIRNYLWLCLHRPTDQLPSAVLEQLQIAYGATERLLTLVKGLLTVSQVETDNLNLELETADLTKIVTEVFQELQDPAAEKNITFLLKKLTSNTESAIDRKKMVEVVYNIVSNAVKFSPRDSKVTVQIRRKKSLFFIEIIDQGQGITPQNQRLLFQKFGRAGRSYRANTDQGTGLGLFIAQSFTHLHGGEVKVSSKLGKGSIFTIVVPIFPLTLVKKKIHKELDAEQDLTFAS